MIDNSINKIEDSQRWATAKYKDGSSHPDSPTLIWEDGEKWWYKDHRRHREDGPAVIFLDGTEEWWLNGVNYKDKVQHGWAVAGLEELMK